MAWLTSSLVASLCGACLLTLVFFFLCAHEKERYLGIWTASWGAQTVRYCMMLFWLLVDDSPLFLAANQLAAMVAGFLLVWGTLVFAGRSWRWLYIAAPVALDALWIVLALLLDLPLLWVSLPTFVYLAAIFTWTGVELLRARHLGTVGRQVTAWAFILWGIHKADYPLLRGIPEAAPWGYLLTGIISFVTALGILIVYFEKARASAQRSEERFRLLAENARDVLFRAQLQPEFAIEYASPSLENVLGYSPEELYADPRLLRQLVNPDDLSPLVEAMQSPHAAAEMTSTRWRRKDGEEIWLEHKFTPIVDASGNYVAVEGVARDVTKARKMQEELARSEARYRGLYQSVSAGIVVRDAAGRLVEINEEAIRILGLVEGEYELGGTQFPGVQMFDEQGNPLPLESYPAMKTLKTGKKVENTTVRLRTAAGDLRWVLISSVPIITGDNNVAGAVATLVDITEGRRMQENLRESERRFREMLQNLDLIAVQIDTETRITFCNDFLLQLTGYKREEVIGKHWSDLFVPPDVWQELEPDWDAYFKQGKPGLKSAYEMVTRTGERRLVHWNRTLLFDESGQIIGAASIGEDVTDRVRAERELEDSRQRLLNILNSISDAFFALDREWRVTYINSKCEELFRKGREEILGNNLWEVFPEATGTVFERWYRQAMAENVSVSFEAYYEPLDIWVEVRVYPHADGIAIYYTDISDRVQAEAQLRHINDELATVIKASPVAIYTMGTEGVITSWNPAAERILGWSEEEVLGQEEPFALPGRQERYREIKKRVLAGESFTNMTERVRRRDGKQVDLSFSVAPLYDAQDQARGLIALAADVTEQKMLEQQLLQAQKMESIGRLAGGIAHDFNNLLTAISGNADFALESLPPEHPARQDIEDILRAAGRAADLTHQLLAFSRRQMLEPKLINLNTLILDMDRLLRRLIGEDVEFVTLPAQDLGLVRVDPVQMEQVLTNLAVNARDAMPGGGTLVIETENVYLDEDYARTHTEVIPGEYVMVAVSDTGIGMTEEVRERLFEPFFTTKREGRGTGLGLPMVYGIVKQHRGSIYIYSEPDRGTTFKIYLPRVREELPESLPNSEALPVTGHETVLVVEDEPSVRGVATRVLAQQGYSVLEAATGDEALRLVSGYREHIDLLITDVIMPHMSGKELATRLRQLRPDIKVLFVSGYTDNAIVHHGVIDEGIAFLQKPFTAATLSHKVREVLDIPGAGGIETQEYQDEDHRD